MSDEKITFITNMVADEMKELRESKTIAEQADALVDAVYYLCDSAVRHGVNLDPLFRIVHNANLKKIVNGSVLRRSDGKILKPADWEDPEEALSAEIQRQIQDGAF